MSKKKKTKVETATEPVSGKELLTLYRKKQDEPQLEVVTELAPIQAKTYKPIPEENNDVLIEHLHVIDIRTELDVPEFRDYTNTGDLAVNILRGYVASGLCVEKWKRGRSYFALTDRGRELLS